MLWLKFTDVSETSIGSNFMVQRSDKKKTERCIYQWEECYLYTDVSEQWNISVFRSRTNKQEPWFKQKRIAWVLSVDTKQVITKQKGERKDLNSPTFRVNLMIMLAAFCEYSKILNMEGVYST
jgi:hypothetical protein